ncbi:DUF1416 domain-containing protein [Streptomyces sp. MI02-7b]|uniref:DUF1416 domain-containing protein n=1 Tax=Streptomyces sp. MI02-7b TaxID=462941 RepID=UPI0029B0D119|nr:DUF1416 domain-containing protein [Streptomyces sp. MI02-7b]MDX3078498.1 DUF1416 domain-containing protein [Streptomyces sp. MI02-7b]
MFSPSGWGPVAYFSVPGSWALRALVPGATVDRAGEAQQGSLTEVVIAVWSAAV